LSERVVDGGVERRLRIDKQRDGAAEVGVGNKLVRMRRVTREGVEVWLILWRRLASGSGPATGASVAARR
jgi:hypothetical protein